VAAPVKKKSAGLQEGDTVAGDKVSKIQRVEPASKVTDSGPVEEYERGILP